MPNVTIDKHYSFVMNDYLDADSVDEYMPSGFSVQKLDNGDFLVSIDPGAEDDLQAWIGENITADDEDATDDIMSTLSEAVKLNAKQLRHLIKEELEPGIDPKAALKLLELLDDMGIDAKSYGTALMACENGQVFSLTCNVDAEKGTVADAFILKANK